MLLEAKNYILLKTKLTREYTRVYMNIHVKSYSINTVISYEYYEEIYIERAWIRDM